jgi:PAS domain-containing protein
VSLENSEPAAWNARHLRLAIDAAGVALWSWNVDTDKLTIDGRGYDLWGVEEKRICLFRRPVSAYPSCRSRPGEGSFRGHAGDLRQLRD